MTVPTGEKHWYMKKKKKKHNTGIWKETNINRII